MDRAIALGALFAGAVFVRAVAGDAPTHADTLRDLLMARECVELPRCDSMGAVSSVGGFVHGASYLRVWTLVSELGGSVGAMQSLLAMLLSLAAWVVAATVPDSGRAWHARAMAFSLVLGATMVASEAPSLFGPALLPLPVALFWAGAVRLALVGDARAVALASLGAAVSVDVHVMAAPLVLLLVTMIAACARRPLRGAALASAILLGCWCLCSLDAVAWNLALLRGWESHVLASLVFTAFVGAEARAFAARGSGREHATRVIAAAAGAYLLVFALSSPFIAHRAGVRYLLPVIPALAWLLASWLFLGAKAGRRGATTKAAIIAAPLVFALGAVAAKRATTPYWRIDEVRTLGRALARDGLGYTALVRHLRGPDAFGVATMSGAFLPLDVSMRDPLGVDDLLVVRAERSDPSLRELERVRLVPLDGGEVAVVRRLRPFLDRSRIELCGTDAATSVRGCRSLDTLAWRPDEGARGYLHRAYLDPTRAGGTSDGIATRVVRIPVDVPRGAAAHRLSLGNVGGRFRLLRVEGSLVTRAVPGDRGWDLVSGTGVLVFERRARGEDHEPRGALPELIETEQNEVALRSLIERALR